MSSANLSTHILDTSKGVPASGVKVHLELFQNESWKRIESGETNSDGRYKFSHALQKNQYQIVFETLPYFQSTRTESFFLNAGVAFEIHDLNRNYHVPLLLNPYGYSTYRGS